MKFGMRIINFKIEYGIFVGVIRITCYEVMNREIYEILWNFRKTNA